MNPELLTSLRELHSRAIDGLQVRLLWDEHRDRTIVAVVDIKRGDAFHVEVPAGERPMEVFDHPFAYAAWRGIHTAVSQLPVPVAA